MAFELVGLGVEAVQYLESGEDPCFGKKFAKTAPECIACRAPAIENGKKLVLLRDVCAKQCLKTATTEFNRLNSRQVLERLEQGKTSVEIFREMVGDAPVKLVGSAVRNLLIERYTYLKGIGATVPWPVPHLKDLKKDSPEEKR